MNDQTATGTTPGPLRLQDGSEVQPGLYIQQGRALCKVSTLYPGENRITAVVCFDHNGDPLGRTTVRGLTHEKLGHWKPASAQIADRYHAYLDAGTPPRETAPGHEDLPEAELRLLRSYADGLRIWDAAALVPAVCSLQDQGLIEPDPDPGRQPACRLTEKGRQVLEAGS